MRSLHLTTAALAITTLSLGCAPEVETQDPIESPSKLDAWAHAFGEGIYPLTVASGPDGRLFVGGSASGNVDLGGGQLPTEDPNSLFLAYYDANGDHLMSGTTGSDDHVRATAIGPDGTLCAIGSATGKLSFGDSTLDGSGDGWVTCFDRDRSLRFSKLIPSDFTVTMHSLAMTPKGHLVIGLEADTSVDFGTWPEDHANEGIAAIAELDPLGYPLWDFRIPWNPSWPVRVTAAPDGSALFTTRFNYSVDLDGAEIPIGTVAGKLDSTGHLVWMQTEAEGGPSGIYVNSQSVDEDGNLYLAGTCVQDGLTFAGLAMPPLDSPVGFVAKISPEGKGLWVKKVVSQDFSAPGLWVGAVPGGGAIVAANTYGPVDFGSGVVGDVASRSEANLARLSPNGAIEDTMSLASYSDVYLVDLTIDPLGQPVLLGAFYVDVQLGPEGSPKLKTDHGQATFLARVAF